MSSVAAMRKESLLTQARWALEMRKHELEVFRYKMQVEAAMRTGIEQVSMGRPTPNSAKCTACGSHEWRQHNSVRICAYCRCGDGTQPKTQHLGDDAAYSRMTDEQIQRFLAP